MNYPTTLKNGEIHRPALPETLQIQIKISLDSGSGTVVQHSAHYSEVKGSNLTTVASTGRENDKKVIKTG
jgi:hypothetical protein